MRVLHVIPGRADDPVGMAFVRRQIQGIAAQGIDCRDFFLAARASPIDILAAIRRLRRTIKESTPDVVHAHYGTVTALVAVLATRRPVIATYRGSDLNPDPSVSRLRSAMQTLLSQIAALGARRIICVSQQLIGRLWWRRERASVVPSGIDLDLFQPIDRAAARRQLGWTHDEIMIFFNAGKPPWNNKRVDLAKGAVEVASRLLARNVRLHVLVGDTPPSEIPLHMNACDCALMTSEFEGSPNVVKEATACNLPVVSVDVGDVTERLAGVAPSFVVARDANALGHALAEVIRSGQRSNGRIKAAELSRDVLATKIISVYRECIAP